MKDLNEIWQGVKMPIKETTNTEGKKTVVDMAGNKARPVSAFLKDDTANANDTYKMVQKTITNKLGEKKTVWIKKFYDNKTGGASAYGQ